MTRRRKLTIPDLPPEVPTVDYPPLPPPARRPSSFDDWNTRKERPYTIAAWPWALPSYQRPRKWTADRYAAYLQSIFDGEPQTPIVAWHVVGATDDRVLCLDGQHRLCALGVQLPGAPTPPVRLDLRTCRWEPGEPSLPDSIGIGPLVHPRHVGEIRRLVAAHGLAWDVHDRLLDLAERMHLDLPVTYQERPDSPEARRECAAFFERMARSVPFTPEELAALGEWSTP